MGEFIWAPLPHREAKEASYVDVRGVGRVVVRRAAKYSQTYMITINNTVVDHVKHFAKAKGRAEAIIMERVNANTKN